MYKALRNFKVQDENRKIRMVKPGDMVPEANTWKNREFYIINRYITANMDEDALPQRPANKKAKAKGKKAEPPSELTEDEKRADAEAAKAREELAAKEAEELAKLEAEELAAKEAEELAKLEAEELAAKEAAAEKNKGKRREIKIS